MKPVAFLVVLGFKNSVGPKPSTAMKGVEDILSDFEIIPASAEKFSASCTSETSFGPGRGDYLLSQNTVDGDRLCSIVGL
jgi:hypothetical protein